MHASVEYCIRSYRLHIKMNYNKCFQPISLHTDKIPQKDLPCKYFGFYCNNDTQLTESRELRESDDICLSGVWTVITIKQRQQKQNEMLVFRQHFCSLKTYLFLGQLSQC